MLANIKSLKKMGAKFRYEIPALSKVEILLKIRITEDNRIKRIPVSDLFNLYYVSVRNLFDLLRYSRIYLFLTTWVEV